MTEQDEVDHLRAELTGAIVDHLIASEGAIATPGNTLATVRREVLRGLAHPPVTTPGSPPATKP